MSLSSPTRNRVCTRDLMEQLANLDIAKCNDTELTEIHAQLMTRPELEDPQGPNQIESIVKDFRKSVKGEQEFFDIVHAANRELVTCIGDINYFLRQLYQADGYENIERVCESVKTIFNSRVQNIFSTLECNIQAKKSSYSKGDGSYNEKFNCNLAGTISRLGSYQGLIHFLTENDLPTIETMAAVLGVICEEISPLSLQPSRNRNQELDNEKSPIRYMPFQSLESILSSDESSSACDPPRRPQQIEVPHRLYFSLDDYLMALIKMSFQLSELAVKFATYGEYELPRRIHKFLLVVQDGLMSIQMKNGALRRAYDRLKYEVKTVANVVYEIGLYCEIGET